MSEHELYEIASQRIKKRNQRWTLWGLNLMGLIFSLAALIFLGNTAYADLSVAIFLAWCGLFTFHTITIGMSESQDSDIEKEVAKMRELVYEKPKRIELSDDGELIDADDYAYEETQDRLSSS